MCIWQVSERGILCGGSRGGLPMVRILVMPRKTDLVGTVIPWQQERFFRL